LKRFGQSEVAVKFDFQNPTRLVFGAGTLSRLGEVVRPHGERALLVTGGGSVKRSGVFARAVASLKAAGVADDRRGHRRDAGFGVVGQQLRV